MGTIQAPGHTEPINRRSRRTSRKTGSGPQAAPFFEDALRSRLDAELGRLFGSFLANAANDLDRVLIRDIFRAYFAGDGLRTAFHTALEADTERCYITVPKRHTEKLWDYLDHLESGIPMLKPLGSGWMLWERPKAQDEANGES